MYSGLDDAARDVALAEVIELELMLLRPTVRGDAETVRRLLREDFEEVGASGKHWHRDAIVDYLERHPGDGFEASQMDATFLSPDVVLVTYAGRSLGADLAISRRSSVWVRDHGFWAMRYHQGTPVD
jgi:ribonuclease HI